MAAVSKQIYSGKRLPSKMGSRTQEIRPVGAWVQPEPLAVYDQVNAVHSAQLEEQRIRRELQEKSEKLRKFQEGVRRRVQALDRAKRDEALRKSYKAVEVERNVICQSTYAAEKLTPRKDRCNIREDKHLHIKQTTTVNTHGGIISDHEQDQEKDAHFEEHTNKVKKFNQQARRKLTSRKLVTEHYLHQDLPGGAWRGECSQNKPAQEEDSKVKDSESDEESDKENIVQDDLNARIVQFEDVDENCNENATQTSSTAAIPNIYPGVQTEDEKIRTQNQRAMYRRLFMDIEREQVRENQRRKQHQRKINDIKARAEAERLAIEEQARSALVPTDPVTGETEDESYQRERDAVLRESQREEERQRQKQRDRETGRFLDALKRNLREKVQKQGVELPPLCCCAVTVWDTNPDTCANNCVFYRNPKAYGRALQSLLSSCDVI